MRKGLTIIFPLRNYAAKHLKKTTASSEMFRKITNLKTWKTARNIPTAYSTNMGVVPCTCNPATLEAESRNSVGSIPVEGNSPSRGGWIVWTPAVQHKERNLSKYWHLTDATYQWTEIPIWTKISYRKVSYR